MVTGIVIFLTKSFTKCNYPRAKDRLTIQEREREEAKARQAEREAARAAEERRRQTLR
jgi:hypothetical protein